MSNWQQKDSDTRKKFPLDIIYTRKRKVLPGIFIGEWLRVVTYPGMTNRRLTYMKRVLSNEDQFKNISELGTIKLIFEIVKSKLTESLNKLIHKDLEVMEVTQSKYIEKFSFLKKHFKDFERERKLKQLGL